MKEVAPIDTCFHPQRLKRGGDFLIVPCGKCPACLRSKQNKWRQRLEHEINNSASTLFITLTYDNKHLPLAHLTPDSYILSHISYTKFDKKGKPHRHEHVFPQNSLESSIFLFDQEPEPTTTNDQPYIEQEYRNTPVVSIPKKTTLDIPHYVTHRINNQPVFDDTPTFAVCLRKDVQDFVKRLRILLYRNPVTRNRNHSFTYFICSEYGPETFRPHYHGLLFFTDPCVASLCKSYFVNAAWRKSNLSSSQLEKQCEFVSVGEGSAAYTSKYVTCHDDLPSVLRHKFFKPFFVCSHSKAIGSSAIPPASIGAAVRDTNLLYTKKYQDKDTRELITAELSYPLSCWSRYFPKFSFACNLPVSLFSKCIARIYQLNPHEPIPNYTHILERKYLVNHFYHSTTRQLHFMQTMSNDTIDHDLWFRIFRRLGLKAPEYHTLQYGYSTNDEIRKITYSDIMPILYQDNNDKDFIELYLFGIPQNRTAVNKILKCRLAELDFSSTPETYLYHYNLYHTKTFNNQIQKQYATLHSHCGSTMSPQDVFEYFPSFVLQMPKKITAFDQVDYEKIANILYNRFTFIPEYFYTPSGDLIDFSKKIYHEPRYYYHRAKIANTFTEFKTKRKYYYNKYGCGEYLTASAPPYPT